MGIVISWNFRFVVVLILTAATMLLFGTAPPSLADCTQTGSEVTCTGEDPNGFYSATPVDVQVEAGATVVNPQDNSNPIRLHDENTVTNDGVIAGNTGGDGLKMDHNNTLINNGTISSEEHDGVDVLDNNTIVNNGEIVTGTAGHEHDDGDKTIDSGNNTVIENNGVINGNGDGIYTGSGSHIVNNEGAVINSEREDGIDGKDNVVVDNYGAITTGDIAANEAIDINHHSEVNNYGTIDGFCDGIDIGHYAEVNNAEGAAIHGEYCNGVDTGMQSEVTNAGTITTAETTGISGVEADWDSTVTNTETGVIEGRCRGVRGTSDLTLVNEGEIHGEVCDGVLITGEGQVYNAGTITTNGDAAIELRDGYIENDGTLDGASNGIKFTGTDTAPATVVNNGTIVGNMAIDAQPSSGSQTIVNNGTLIGETGAVVKLGAGNDTMDTLAGATIEGTMDGGADHDILQFRYRFEATSFYIPDEYRVMEATVLAAPTTGCPCQIELIISGTTYRYWYRNFEQLRAFFEFVQLQYQAQDDVYTAGGFTAYALTNNGFRTGSIAVYHTITGQGVHVTTFDAWQVSGSATFAGTDGWTVIVDEAAMEGSTRVLSMSVLDAEGTVRGTSQILLFDNGSMAWR